MAFVVYHKDTTILLKTKDKRTSFPSEGSAKAALTRAVKAGGVNREHYAITEAEYFFARIEKKETRIGVGPAQGKEYIVGVNESWTSGPWSETYWSS